MEQICSFGVILIINILHVFHTNGQQHNGDLQDAGNAYFQSNTLPTLPVRGMDELNNYGFRNGQYPLNPQYATAEIQPPENVQRSQQLYRYGPSHKEQPPQTLAGNTLRKLPDYYTKYSTNIQYGTNVQYGSNTPYGSDTQYGANTQYGGITQYDRMNSDSYQELPHYYDEQPSAYGGDGHNYIPQKELVFRHAQPNDEQRQVKHDITHQNKLPYYNQQYQEGTPRRQYQYPRTVDHMAPYPQGNIAPQSLGYIAPHQQGNMARPAAPTPQAVQQNSYTLPYSGNSYVRGKFESGKEYDSTHTIKTGRSKTLNSKRTEKSGGGYVLHQRKKRKKKRMITSIDQGFHVSGGMQQAGKFPTLKSCMKACAASPTCFGGDYNPWLNKCYFHSNSTACGTMSAHTKFTHFKKVPCTVPVINANTLITLGTRLNDGLWIKGITDFSKCLKTCANAGGGIAASPAALDTANNGGQICFGIDFDFSTHRCYAHTHNIRRAIPPVAQIVLCAAAGGTPVTPLDLLPSPTTVNVIICPPD